MLRLYYHLYLGRSWQTVWNLHRPLLQDLCVADPTCKIIVCIVGKEAASPELSEGSPAQFEFRVLPSESGLINEFQTLRELRHDARHLTEDFDYCAYMHSKGSSSQLTPAGIAWSTFLATALTRALPHFPRVAEMGFSALGSNLAWGIFEDFGAPRLHYSGNFWCSTRSGVTSTHDIKLGNRYAAIRHNAEWWLSTSSAFAPFNLFSTGVDHYRSSPDCIDWPTLQKRIDSLQSWSTTSIPLDFIHSEPNPKRAHMQNEFVATMLRHASGEAPGRQTLSEALLRLLPYHRAPRLLNVHDALMKRMGSRKSTYFYCPESL